MGVNSIFILCLLESPIKLSLYIQIHLHATPDPSFVFLYIATSLFKT